MGNRKKKTPVERRKERQVPLREQLVSTQMQHRYTKAVLALLTFWSVQDLTPTCLEDFDPCASQWVEQVYMEGEHKGLASDALAGLVHFLSPVHGKLRHSWKLLKTWSKLEPPDRAVPFTDVLLVGFAGLCYSLQYVQAAALLLVGFDTFMRSGELYAMQVKHVTFMRGKAVISIPDSKTTGRKNAKEMVVVQSTLANRVLQEAIARRLPGEHVYSKGPAHFRKLFSELKQTFKISSNLTVYSLRRGGATADFLGHGSMEMTLLRGRWASTSTARIYVQDAVATIAHLALTEEQKQLSSVAAQAFA